MTESDLASTVAPEQQRRMTWASDEALLREYQELCANMRHYGNARLTRLTMLLALSGGLLYLLHGRNAVNEPAASVLELAGLFLAALFWVVDLDVVFNWRCFRDSAIEVEGLLGLKQFTNRKSLKSSAVRRIVSETRATYSFYALTILFWVVHLATW